MRTISSNAQDGVTVYICMYVLISSSFKFVGGFQLTTVTFKRIFHVNPQSSGILLQTHHSFSLKFAPKLSFISASGTSLCGGSGPLNLHSQKA